MFLSRYVVNAMDLEKLKQHIIWNVGNILYAESHYSEMHTSVVLRKKKASINTSWN
jgi:hypothetical protein